MSNDKCTDSVCIASHPLGLLSGTGNPLLGNAQRYQLFALGGLVEYNFGPASLSVWATQEVYAKATGAGIIPAGVLGATAVDLGNTTKGMTVFATLSYRLWAPEEPAKAPMLHK